MDWDTVLRTIQQKTPFTEVSFQITDSRIEEAKDTVFEAIAIRLALSETPRQEKPDSLSIPQNKINSVVPQPKIGAVLKCGKQIFASARSGRRIGDHAEFTVIGMAKDKLDLKEATLYTTLEPCTPDSRSKWTSSCSTLITELGIPEVFIGAVDANPLVTGMGLKSLLDAKIKVHLFDPCFSEDLAKINPLFFAFFRKMPDYKAIKKAFNYVVPDLDVPTVQYYCRQAGLMDSEPIITIDVMIKFLSLMINERQIFESDDLRKVDVSDEFALLFFENPNKKVPGFRVNIYNKAQDNRPSHDTGINSERKPLRSNLLRILTTNIGNADESINIFVRILFEITKKKNSFNNDISLASALNLVVPDVTAVRELVINALVHNNYHLSPVIDVAFQSDEIQIYNAIDLHEMNINEIARLKKALNYGNVFSQPINHFIMDVLEECHLTEQHSLGMASIEKKQEIILKGFDGKNKSIFLIGKNGIFDSVITSFSIEENKRRHANKVQK